MDIKNAELINFLNDWQNDFSGAIDVEEFKDEYELIEVLREELLPLWINNKDVQKEDKLLYIEYLDRLKAINI